MLARIAIAILLIILAAPLGGALTLLVFEGLAVTEVGVATIILLLVLLAGIGRGLGARARATTTYW